MILRCVVAFVVAGIMAIASGSAAAVEITSYICIRAILTFSASSFFTETSYRVGT